MYHCGTIHIKMNKKLHNNNIQRKKNSSIQDYVFSILQNFFSFQIFIWIHLLEI